MFGKKTKEPVPALEEVVQKMSKENPIALTTNGEFLYLPEGLSKREQFAMSAMHGMLSHWGPGLEGHIASMCFGLADAMIFESEKSKQ